MAKKSAKTCEYCGIHTGRGKRHKLSCPRSKQQNKTNRKPHRPFSMNTLKDYPVQDLLAIREELDALIKSKGAELAGQIKTLQAALRKIRGK